MSFTIAQLLPQNPTGATGGQIIAAYKASRFASPTVAPATNTAAPGNGPGGAGDTSPDGGPVTTGANDIGGLITVATFEPYMVSYYDPADTDPANGNGGSPNVYWLGPLLPITPDSTKNWTAWHDYSSGGRALGTTYTNGSSRREVRTVISFTINAAGDAAYASRHSRLAGLAWNGGNIGINWNGAPIALLLPVDMDVDPGATYHIDAILFGGATMVLNGWTERDY